jgi:phage terminase large subunit-like protein
VTELRFSVERADQTQDFVEKLCVHTKGRHARRPFTLTDWQRDEIVRPLFGTVRYDEQLDEWVRAYRLAWLEVARKNGKSELLAALALKLLVGDHEESAEVYGAARDRDQARKVFDVAQRMVELSPVLSKRLRIFPSSKRIVDPKTASYYEVIAADAAGNLGHNPHGIVFDEVLTQPSRELWDALKTGMGARAQPLMIAATTAGNDANTLAGEEHAFSMKVRDDPSLDPSRFVFIRSTPRDADWRDEASWHEANPALGDFLSLSTLRDEAKEAESSPAKENAFRQFRLNQWVSQATRWLPLHSWDASAGMVDETELRGRRAFGGLDLASSTDIAALCWTFRDGEGDEESYCAAWRFWVPQERLGDLERRTGGAATRWVREGWLRTTEGDVIDYRAILATIDRDAQTFDVHELAYDRWGMTQLATDLADNGMTVVPFGQGFASMSPPTKEWERLVLDKRYRHGGNPVMRWMVDNITVRTDPAGNIKIDKAKSTEKVDGCVAAVMALDRASRYKPKPTRRAVGF